MQILQTLKIVYFRDSKRAAALGGTDERITRPASESDNQGEDNALEAKATKRSRKSKAGKGSSTDQKLMILQASHGNACSLLIIAYGESLKTVGPLYTLTAESVNRIQGEGAAWGPD